MQSRQIFIAALIATLELSAAAADWTLIHTAKNGTRWYSADSVQLQDGSIRTWLKMQQGKNVSAPFAILLKCETKEARNYQAGAFGSELHNPWKAIPPESAGEVAFDALCMKRQTSDLIQSPSSAIRSNGPSGDYASLIRSRVSPNIVFEDNAVGNPVVEVELQMASDGTITGRRITISSGSSAWDQAVLRALDRTMVLPRDSDGQIYSPIRMEFRARSR